MGPPPEARTHVEDIHSLSSGTGMPVPYLGLLGMSHDVFYRLNGGLTAAVFSICLYFFSGKSPSSRSLAEM